MRKLIPILIGLLVVGCGKNQPEKTNESNNTPVIPAKKKVGKETPSKGDENKTENNEESPRSRWDMSYEERAAIGDKRAQLELGSQYMDGFERDKDLIKSYVWFSLAATNGMDNLFPKWVAGKMTSEDIDKAKILLKEMIKNNPKLINK